MRVRPPSVLRASAWSTSDARFQLPRAAHCTHCAAYVQRRHLKKGDIIIDCLLAWCCPHCVIMQNANEVGEAATYSHWTLKDLLKPPTAQDINKGAIPALSDTSCCVLPLLIALFAPAEIKDTVNDATSGL